MHVHASKQARVPSLSVCSSLTSTYVNAGVRRTGTMFSPRAQNCHVRKDMQSLEKREEPKTIKMIAIGLLPTLFGGGKEVSWDTRAGRSLIPRGEGSAIKAMQSWQATHTFLFTLLEHHRKRRQQKCHANKIIRPINRQVRLFQRAKKRRSSPLCLVLLLRRIRSVQEELGPDVQCSARALRSADIACKCGRSPRDSERTLR